MSLKEIPTAIIQARMGSTRLPGKSLVNIAGEPLIKRVLDSVKGIDGIGRIVLATTILEEDTELADFGAGEGVDVFRGDPADVLDRYYSASLKYSADPVIRICADSPIIAAGFAAAMLKRHIELGSGYTCGVGILPLGPVPVIISFAALETANREAVSNHHREHIVPYILENRDRFSVCEIESPKELKYPYRLTIDEDADLRMFNTLYAEFEAQGLEPSLESAIGVLRQNSDIAKINAEVKQVVPGKNIDSS
jgi:spore coat polysaccharide biosynthesis protein SpsF